MRRAFRKMKQNAAVYRMAKKYTAMLMAQKLEISMKNVVHRWNAYNSSALKKGFKAWVIYAA